MRLVAFLVLSWSLPALAVEDCSNLMDDDGDGFVDCLDPDCPACVEDCFNGIDDDFDSLPDCDDPDCASEDACCDADGDGYIAAGGICGGDDCNDSPFHAGASIHPGMAEVPADQVDSDCDGFEDCYWDMDGDGYGRHEIIQSASFGCTGAGVSANPDDCNDTLPGGDAIHPGASEVAADGIDQDCDGLETCYADSDGDGYGRSLAVPTSSMTCSVPGLTGNAEDCDDTRSDVNPEASEIPLSGTDEDCDGLELCYADSDGDGYGDTSASLVPTIVLHCVGPATADVGGDCDDGSHLIFPGATEAPADGVDANCDGFEDCYVDGDGDAYGTPIVVPTADGTCTSVGVATSASDCNDLSADVYPGAPEIPDDGVDQDCDGFEVCFEDGDADGWAGDTVLAADLTCSQWADVVGVDDCDDQDATVHPDRPELCDSIDNDCDGDVDEGIASRVHFVDRDLDGFGDGVSGTSVLVACPPPGFSPWGTDCDDMDATVHPLVDPAARDHLPLATHPLERHEADRDPSFVADGIDQDCDGVDLCYVDLDDDGYGATPPPGAETQFAADNDLNCANASAATAGNDDDCDDTNPIAFPGATEVVGDGFDQDCDGADACWEDLDGDGFGSDVVVVGLTEDCDAAGAATASLDGDCRDEGPLAASVNPLASEVCDAMDNDCDGLIDEVSSPDAVESWLDVDGDGFGDPNTVLRACGVPVGFADNPDDCDDDDALVNPDGLEVCDGVDNDCDTDVDEQGVCDTASPADTGDTDVPSVNATGDCASGCRGTGSAYLAFLPLAFGLRRRREPRTR